MRRYETIVILKPTLGEEDNQAVIDRITEIIGDFGGSIIKIDKWGLKKLAYLIKKEAQGYYVYMVYAGMPAGVDEMERILRIDDRAMKFLTVKLQDVYTPLPEDEDGTTSEETTTTTAAAESKEPVAEVAPEKVAEPVAEEATEKAAEPVAEEVSEKAAEPVAEAATEETEK